MAGWLSVSQYPKNAHWHATRSAMHITMDTHPHKNKITGSKRMRVLLALGLYASLVVVSGFAFQSLRGYG